MRYLFVFLILALAAAGAYAYTTNPEGCRKLGNDIVADLNSIFKRGSDADAAAAAPSAPAAPAGPKHWQPGFVTQQPSAPSVPAPTINPSMPASPATPAPTGSPATVAAVPAATVPSSLPPQVAPPSRPFTEFTNYDMALNEARSENKPLLILFSGMDWNDGSQALQAGAISRPAFQRYSAAHFVFLDLDYPHKLADDDGALNAPDESNALSSPRNDSDLALLKVTMKKYNVTGVPTIIVVNPDEQQLGRINGAPEGGAGGLISKLDAIVHQ